MLTRTAPRVQRQGVALWCAILALMLTLLLEALDQTVVGTAMPRIIGQLHGLDRYTWTISAYLVASTTLIPIAGKLSDQFGRKRFLLGGTALFLLGSLLCGSAQSIDQLIVFRALQGAGAGIGMALVFTTVGDLVLPAERGKWQGIVGAVYAISSVSGPTLGGWLADHGPLLRVLITDASRWRWVFFLNLPLGVIALAALLIFLPSGAQPRGSDDERRAARHSIDFLGAFLATSATVCLLFGLTWGGEGGSSWSQPQVTGALLGAGFLYAALIAAERKAKDPMLPLRLFRNQTFAADAVLAVLLNMALFGMAFYAPLFLQGVVGASATQSGATMTPFSVSIAVAGSLAGLAISALKRCRVIALVGAALMTAGAGLLARMAPSTSLMHTSLLVSAAGLGIGTLLSVVGVVSLNAVTPADMGAGVAAVRYLGQIGGAVGVAIVGTVVNASFTSEVDQRLSSAVIRRLDADGVRITTTPQLLVDPAYRTTTMHAALRTVTSHAPADARPAQVLASTRQVQQLLDQFFGALRLSLAAAIQHGFLAVLICSVAALVAAVFLTDGPEQQRR